MIYRTCIVRHWFASQKIVGAFALTLLFLLARFLLHVEASEASVNN